MENVVRVDCLYRVSTIGQVEKNDIPMQREFCRAFIAEHPNWKLEKEVYEKGVSGFKKSAKERDAIQELQRDAVEGRFDILLVYMFDRLGRKDDETPFIVEWFVRNGVEVWSATERQQRFDTHADKLLNYIRYWQASGESIKTSVRTKTRLEQLTESGLYTGGSIAYGYRLDISETQMSHVTNVEAGHGLMRIGSSIIPFINEFPRDSELYRLMSTTPGDK